MTQVYIAASLDGYIARPNGAVDWLDKLSDPKAHEKHYLDFYGNVGSIIMGRKTYEEVLGFGVDWPYANVDCYIATRKPGYATSTPQTKVLSSLSKEVIREIEESHDGNLWIVGGGEVVAQLWNNDLIDEWIIAVIPVILGEGLPLFKEGLRENWLSLEKVETFDSGAVCLTYRRA
jgi:dihydrofolate reductase